MLGTLALAGCRSNQKVAAKSPVTPLPVGSFARAWTAPLELGSDVVREMHLTGDRLFVYTGRNTSCVVNRNSGHLDSFSDVQVGGGVLKAPVMMGDYIVYPTTSTLEIFNLRGRPLKSIPLDSPLSASGVGAGNIVYVGENKLGGYGRLCAIDITRNAAVPRWGILTRGAITGRPAYFEKIIYCGSENGSLMAVTEDGGVAWPGQQNSIFKAGGAFMSDIHADDTGVYAANTDTKLYCLERNSGRIKWQYYATAALKTGPSVTSSMVYQWVPGRGLAAIDKNNGGFNREPRWIIRDAEQFLSEDETHSYLRRRDNTLIAVDKETGKVQFTSRSKSFNFFASNTQDAMIYACTRSGILVAIRPVLNAGEAGELVLNVEPLPLGG
jgi:outer membrane protein assembly factor BamB